MLRDTRKVYEKSLEYWLDILDSETNVKKKCIHIINDLFQQFNSDDHLLIHDFYGSLREAINSEEREDDES